MARSMRTASQLAARKTPRRAGTASASPGQATPMASVNQKAPKLERIAPTPNLSQFSGTIVSGRIRPGDSIVVAKSGKQSRVKRIVTQGGDLKEAVAGQAVTLVLADEVDISRGDVLAAADNVLSLSLPGVGSITHRESGR